MSRSYATQCSTTNDDFYVVYIKMNEEREREIKMKQMRKGSGEIFYFVKINASWLPSNEEKSKVDFS